MFRIALWGFFGAAKSLPFWLLTWSMGSCFYQVAKDTGTIFVSQNKTKRKNTLYLSHKNPFNGLTIIFNTIKFLTLVIFLSTCDYDCSLLSHFWVYTVFFQVFALAPPQAVLCRTEAARNAVTNHRRPWKAERRKPSPSHLPLRAYFHVERLVWIRGRYFHVLC